MSITAFAAGSYVNERSTANLLAMKGRLDTLTTQLVTGRAAQTYGGLGSGRVTSLDAHAAVGRYDGYIAAASNAKTRVNLASISLTDIKTISDGTRTRLLNSLQTTTGAGVSNSLSQARSNFDAAIDALNQQVAGNYIFSGRKTDTEPVLSSQLIFDGDTAAGLDGLKTLIAEQQAADLGPDGSGRLTSSVSGTTVSLTEDTSVEARANFGFRLVNVASSNGNGVVATLSPVAAQGGELQFASVPADGTKVRVGVLMEDGSQKVVDLTARAAGATGAGPGFTIGATPAASASNLKDALRTLLGSDKIASIQSGTPPEATLAFPANGPGSMVGLEVKAPVAGDTVSVTLGMRDGTTTVVKLTASTDPDAPNSFLIDTTSADEATRAMNTAANLESALKASIKSAAETELAASSVQRASDDLFRGASAPGLEPRRVSGNGYATNASAQTVIWYQGEDSADPRGTATIQVGTGQMASIGAQANEEPIRATLAGLAALAATSLGTSVDSKDISRFAASATRTIERLTTKSSETSVADLVTSFGLASSTMENAATQARAAKELMQDSVEGIETISIEEVAAKLMNLQTQLQASYQVSSMISRLTLANYLN